jgi:hypothetical protein
MKFQVVLQWPADSLCDFEEMVGLENLLIARLSRRSEVDGHNFGSGETNIFILTDDALQAFQEIENILSGHDLWPEATGAYRHIDGVGYRVLRPPGSTNFDVR